MLTSAFIQLASACIGIIGSLFFTIGVMRQTIEAMARLSGSYWDWNPHMPIALAAQKADYLFGGGLIFVAFVLQLASFLVPTEQILTASQAALAPWVACVVTAVGFFVLRTASKRLARYFEEQITLWLRKEEMLEPNKSQSDE